MALEKSTKDDKIEIVDCGDWKVIQVRTATIVTDDGAELSRSFHRHVVSPNNDVSGESDEVKKLAEIRDLAMQNGNYPAAVAAEKSRGQAAGIYIDRKEILHGRIDQMDRDQVIKEIEKLQKEFPALAALADSNMLIEHEKDS